MNNQEILETLSELECILYYKADRDNPEQIPREKIRKARDLVNEALLYWRDITGLNIYP